MIMPIGAFRPRPGWQNERQFFYKYARPTTALAILEGKRLRWSTPATLNDPFDTRFDMPIELDPRIKQQTLDRLWNMHYGDGIAAPGNRLGEAVRALRGIFPKLDRVEFDQEFGESFDEALVAMREGVPAMQRELASQMSTSKILCLTEVPDNLLMWAHYAESHTGACFEFQSVPEFDSPWGAARAVEYVEKLPLFADADTVSRVLAGEAVFDHRTIMDRFVYSKSVHWAYEREWRVFSGDGRERTAPYEDIPFHVPELSSVILGINVGPDFCERVESLLRDRYPGATLRQAHKSQSAFELTISET